MENIIVIAIVSVIIIAIVIYLRHEKKCGNKCIGCPYAKHCGGKCSGHDKNKPVS